jgi:hypothetical protein
LRSSLASESRKNDARRGHLSSISQVSRKARSEGNLFVGYTELKMPEDGNALISKPITPEVLALAIRDSLMAQARGEHSKFAA